MQAVHTHWFMHVDAKQTLGEFCFGTGMYSTGGCLAIIAVTTRSSATTQPKSTI